MNAAYQLTANWIGSDDSFVPQAMFTTLNRDAAGFQARASHYGAMVSSVDDLLDALYDQFEDDDDDDDNNRNQHSGKKSGSGSRSGSGSGSNSPFSPENILSALNIQSDDSEQLEGNMLISSLQWKRFIAFDNNTIEQLPRCKYR